MGEIVLLAKRIELIIYFSSPSQQEYMSKNSLKRGIQLLSQEMKKAQRSKRKLPTIQE